MRFSTGQEVSGPDALPSKICVHPTSILSSLPYFLPASSLPRRESDHKIKLEGLVSAVSIKLPNGDGTKPPAHFAFASQMASHDNGY